MTANREEKRVLIFTGHLIDAAGREEKRFPVGMLEEARRLIRTYLDEEIRHDAPDVAVTSLGAGGDMIFADEVLKSGIPLIVFLPFEKERFLKESVSDKKMETVDQSGRWTQEFERILEQANRVIYSDEEAHESNPFEACNLAMLEYALTEAGEYRELVSAIALMRPQELLK